MPALSQLQSLSLLYVYSVMCFIKIMNTSSKEQSKDSIWKSATRPVSSWVTKRAEQRNSGQNKVLKKQCLAAGHEWAGPSINEPEPRELCTNRASQPRNKKRNDARMCACVNLSVCMHQTRLTINHLAWLSILLLTEPLFLKL